MDTGDNIVLIGMPGVGKSTLGVVLAKMLNYDFLDCDLVIQSTAGKTLQDIIDESGAEAFLAFESEVLCSLDAHRSIISTGGSAIYSRSAMEHLGDMGAIVYLKAGLDEISRRLGGLDDRGVVMRDRVSMELSDIYDERIPLYERFADMTLDVDGMDIRTSATALARLLGEHGCI